jgi:Phosphoadenosine phosphosulfate reductase family
VSTTCFDLSGGMESAAMLVIARERLLAPGAMVRWVDTGKQFPEMAASIAQIENELGIEIVRVPCRITFDQFLFERGGMLRKGMNDCSRRMKRSNLTRHLKEFPRPWEVNLGFNADETERADDFVERNERPWCHWRFPLIEANIDRAATFEICERAGFTILLEMYRKMGRFDCYWCPNQTERQAVRVAQHYPELAKEWAAAEQRKGFSFMRLPLKELIAERDRQGDMFERSIGCSCFGGTEDVWGDD